MVSVDDSATHFKVPEQKTRQERHTLLPNRAVRGVSLAVDDGEVFVILGLNRSGKSVLLSMLSGEITPTQGSVFTSGHDVRIEPKRSRRRDVLACVPTRTRFLSA